MNKDVIYIDIEDDITAIIGKVKVAATKIVALVPPKRVGVLQSAVNLKLLQKAALGVDKRVVLITNDHSLITLAAGLRMPVAKNLQSRPEIPQMEAPEEPEEEVINGQELPVGDVAKSLDKSPKEPAKSPSAIEEIDEKVDLGVAAVAAAKGEPVAKEPVKKLGLADKLGKGKMSIPNFDIFRKRVFLIVGGGVLLVALLIWAFAFAPHATVTISAKTSDVNVDRTLTLTPSIQASDTAKFTLKPTVQQLKKAVAAEFQATGKKDVGEKAKGNMTIRNAASSDGVSVPAGTVFVGDDGHRYTSDANVVVPGAKVVLGSIQPGQNAVAVTAADIGTEYNVDVQDYTVQGYSGLDGTGTAMAGGTKQTVTVVSQEDVDKAKQQLGSQNVDAAKSELKKLFSADQQIVEESFTSEQAAPSVSPNVGEQATTAKLTVETTYTYVGLARTELKTILTDAMNEVLKDKSDQQIYTLGDNSIIFRNFEKTETGFKVKLVTTGSLGPKIDSKQLASQLVGKRYGEIQAIVNQIPGVNNVDITFSPFWVTTAPGADKIDIKFSVKPN